ncbi:phytanoyl-CoA dioxygenase family protein (plasmid) [Sphingobium fuliginis]|jgi:ectoine hydroxylase-related dioxygenase (phytanoyl-CoA dioxygenase family)|uniref:Phytanoyl-CoA dioxygenase family protein n=1 Tax=Sphingobium fuliginis (strain ATCC 27551) TaxID=336203 RepID=A0A7M2GP12_SPHSA|nr:MULTISPECIES: phytanoyl-CoA dioxygenase family protein [Sphingobium]QOT74484.1 phytanoyl-CoA dioxygenase family protein [Sphingobium fuliginis]
MATIASVSNDTSVDAVCEIIDRDGAVIIEGMIIPGVMDQLVGDLEPWIKRSPFGEAGFSGNRTRRTSALFAKSRHMTEFVLHPLFLGTAERLLCVEFPMMAGERQTMVRPTVQVSVTQAIEISPGQAAQDLHRDDGMYHVRHPGPHVLLQTLLAGTDFTASNGATMVIPGSHKWDMDRRPQPHEAVPAEMKRGSGLMYVGSVYHGGGANISNECRLAIALSFTQGYHRQEENQYLVVPRDMVKQYPKRVQQLLGYEMSPPFCGWVEMNEPSIVLESDDFAIAEAFSPYEHE